MNKEIQIKAADGSGSFMAFVAMPETLPAPAVVVIQEVFGINKFIRAVCEDLAKDGYIALAPDLFWRQEPGAQLSAQVDEEMQRAMKLYQGFDIAKGIEDLKSTLSFARKMDGCTGKAGTRGYCLGGKLAYLMATRSDADCNVSYYGVGIENMLDESTHVEKPYLMHIAGKDKHTSEAVQKKLQDGLKSNRHVTIYIYPEADHAFARINGAHYDEAAATLANKRTQDLLAASLKG